MRPGLALWLLLAGWVALASGAEEKANELASLAGEWTADSRVRAGQQPADKAVLKALTLEIKGDRWAQNFGGDIAPYVITLDKTQPNAMVLRHLKVNAQRKCHYLLEGDRLTVIEQVGEPGDDVTTVWRRKPNAAK